MKILPNIGLLVIISAVATYGDSIPQDSQIHLDTLDLTGNVSSICEKHNMTMEKYNSIYIDANSSPIHLSFEDTFQNCRKTKTVEVESPSLVIQYYCENCEAEKKSYLAVRQQKAEEDLEKAVERYRKKEERKKKRSEK